MIKVNILTAGFTSPNGVAFLFPLIRFGKHLRAAGYELLITNRLNEETTDCDFLLLDSKYFKNDWSQNFGRTLETIAAISESTKIIWCDQADSSGTFLGQVLPWVYRYAKAQLLSDRKEYLKTHYASRIYTDYYHKKYGVTDKDPYIEQPVKDEADLLKLCVSWNSGLMNYGWISPYLMKLREYVPLDAILQFSRHVVLANAHRPLGVTCRMGIPYARDTVCFQRRKMREILADRLPTDKLSRRQYFREMAQSKLCISPFGFGEITLKDFECFLMGSLLVKPDMSHMDTWPNFYERNVTYAAHSWDLDDIEEIIERWLANDTERLALAQAGQQRYIWHTTGPEAGALFAGHFKEVVA